MRRSLLWLAPLFVSCSLVQSVVSSNVERPSLTFKELKLPRVDLEGADLNLVFEVTNPNSVGLNLAQADYALEIEGHRLLGGKPEGGLKIPARGTGELILPASLHWKDLAPAVETLFTKDKIDYKASGTVGLNSPLGLVSLPIEHQGSFDAPKLPKIDIGSPRIVSLSLSAARLVLPLKVGNLNTFPLALGGLRGAVQIAGANVGQIAVQQPQSVPPGQEMPLELPLDVNFLKAGSAVAQAIHSGVAEVKIDGALDAGGATLPVSLAKTLEFNRATGSAER